MTVQQATLESTFQEMGYASSTDYAIRKAQEEILREIKISLDAIAVFEEKYDMDFIQFRERFSGLTQFGLFEREDDSMDWSAEMAQLRLLEKRLGKLMVNANS